MPVEAYKILDTPTAAPIPAGMREAESGLVVPEALSRHREAWTQDEIKFARRAQRFFEGKRLDFTLICLDCAKAEREAFVTAVRQPTGAVVLQCECRDRVEIKNKG